MVRFLSPEWLAGLAAAARQSDALGAAAASVDVSIRHVVHGGPDGEVAYSVRLAGGTVTVLPGADDGDVHVTSDYATAAAISQGRLSPAAAFASGRLKLGGRVGVLAGVRGRNGLRGPNAETGLRGPNAETGLRGPNAETGPGGLLAGLGDVFGSLRDATEY